MLNLNMLNKSINDYQEKLARELVNFVLTNSLDELENSIQQSANNGKRTGQHKIFVPDTYSLQEFPNIDEVVGQALRNQYKPIGIFCQATCGNQRIRQSIDVEYVIPALNPSVKEDFGLRITKE